MYALTTFGMIHLVKVWHILVSHTIKMVLTLLLVSCWWDLFNGVTPLHGRREISHNDNQPVTYNETLGLRSHGDLWTSMSWWVNIDSLWLYLGNQRHLETSTLKLSLLALNVTIIHMLLAYRWFAHKERSYRFMPHIP